MYDTMTVLIDEDKMGNKSMGAKNGFDSRQNARVRIRAFFQK